jgi:hypothetical protein
LPSDGDRSITSTSAIPETEWDMLMDFTKKQFAGLSFEYTSSKDKRDVLRKAIMASG